MSEEALKRDEHFQQLLDYKDKVKQLDTIILEGQHAEDFRSKHPFWPILERTLKSMRELANANAHKASRDSRAEISHFLGSEESIKDILSLFDEFSTRADSAADEKKVAEDQIKELNSILATPEVDAQDIGGAL